MEVRPLVSCSTRALLTYQTGYTTLLRQTGLIHPSRFARHISLTTPTRALSTSTPSSAPAFGTAEAVREDHQNQQTQGKPQQQPKQPQQHRPSTSFFQRRTTQGQGSGQGSGTDKLNSVTNLLDNMGIKEQPSYPRGPNANRFRAQDQAFGNQVSDLLTGRPRTPWDLNTFEALRAASRQEVDEASKIDLRLSPTVGRSVPVKSGGLAVALAQLNARVRQNKVASDLRKQRFHVRRGQLKKNLKSERWRKLFKTSFKATVERCERLRRQGW